jgi:hypothetical protein
MLCDPRAIARWAPVDFEVLGLESDRLRSGAQARVQGALAGRRLTMDVDVHHAGADGLSLSATGPIDLDVEYELTRLQRGSLMRASVSVAGRGAGGRLLAAGTQALLRAGALDVAVRRIRRELDCIDPSSDRREENSNANRQ